MRIFDSHFHIFAPSFPLQGDAPQLPAAFPVEEYRRQATRLGIDGGVLVSTYLQGVDQTFLYDALPRLGPNFVAVTQLPNSVSDSEIHELNGVGVRGVRFNLQRGGMENTRELYTFARRVYDLVGWHVELCVDSRHLEALMPVILTLPAISIDHMGIFASGLDAIFKLASENVKIKATGFGRVNFDVLPAIKKIAYFNEEALMFGTDLPCAGASRPFTDADIYLIKDGLGEPLAAKVLWQNARQFYRLEPY